MSIDMLVEATELLTARGWPMLPSRGTRKIPCVNWKRYQNELPTIDELREWDRSFHTRRWGVVTGALAGIVVADFDGKIGVELMKAWGMKPHVRTGSGGCHVYLRHPRWAVPTMNAKTAKRIWRWPELDIRGDGGFAVLLGRNQSGSYIQLPDLDPDPFDRLPAEVREHSNRTHADEKRPVSSPRQSLVAVSQNPLGIERLIGIALEVAVNDGRNNAGFWLACQLRGRAGGAHRGGPRPHSAPSPRRAWSRITGWLESSAAGGGRLEAR